MVVYGLNKMEKELDELVSQFSSLGSSPFSRSSGMANSAIKPISQTANPAFWPFDYLADSAVQPNQSNSQSSTFKAIADFPPFAHLATNSTMHHTSREQHRRFSFQPITGIALLYGESV
jgi:hypothetical protein